MERYLNLSLPFGLVPTEATIGSYRQKPSARALHRVYSVEATFGSEKRCFHRYETGGEQWPVSAASSHQLSPHWHKASGSESKEKMLHSVAEAGRGGENALGSRKSIGISSLACCELWVKMRADGVGLDEYKSRRILRCSVVPCRPGCFVASNIPLPSIQHSLRRLEAVESLVLPTSNPFRQ